MDHTSNFLLLHYATQRYGFDLVLHKKKSFFLQNLFLRIVGFDFYVRPHKDYPNDTPKPTYKPASLGIPIGISYCFDFGLLLELNHVPTLGTTSYTQLSVGYRF